MTKKKKREKPAKLKPKGDGVVPKFVSKFSITKDKPVN